MSTPPLPSPTLLTQNRNNPQYILWLNQPFEYFSDWLARHRQDRSNRKLSVDLIFIENGLISFGLLDLSTTLLLLKLRKPKTVLYLQWFWLRLFNSSNISKYLIRQYWEMSRLSHLIRYWLFYGCIHFN